MKKSVLIGSLLAFLSIGCSACVKSKSSELDDNKYTVTWKNYNGSVLEIDEEVPEGSMPSYDGKTPLRFKDEVHDYTFTGWIPEPSPIYEDTTYYAQYETIIIASYVTFDLNGGTTRSDSSSKYIPIECNYFFFDVTRDGYIFRGWEYNGEKVFDEKGNKVRDVELKEQMTFKAIFVNSVHVTIDSNIKGAGAISGAGDYNLNETITLNVVVYEGYEFIGWCLDDGEFLSEQKSFRYNVGVSDTKIIAKFDYTEYRLSVESFNDSFGLVSIKNTGKSKSKQQDTILKYQTNVTITAHSNSEADFLGWFDGDNKLVSTNLVYEFNMPSYDCSYIAKWNAFKLDVYSNNDNWGTVNQVSNYYSYKETVDLVASPNTGAEFVGWYLNNAELLSTSPTYSVTMEDIDVTIVARFKLLQFNINAYTLNTEKGSVSGSGLYDYGSEVTLTATPNNHYLFKGWYLDNELLSNDNPYTFTIGTVDLQIEARFAGELFTISFITNDGDPISDLTEEYGEPISIQTNRKGYTLAGWYTDSSLSDEYYLELGNTMPAYNGTLYAKWDVVYYTIRYHMNLRTTNNPGNPATYTIETETFSFYSPSVEGGTFVGWYKEALYMHQITKIEKGSTGDIDLYAKDNAKSVTLSFVTNCDDSLDSIKGGYLDHITVPTPVNEGKIFVGWFTDKELTQRAYITLMPRNDTTLYAKWADINVPFEIGEEKYIYFGRYPRSVVSDYATKRALLNITETNSRGYYEYNGAEYAKKMTRLYWYEYENARYANGTMAYDYSDEFFKVEPILWRILKTDTSGTHTLLADETIDTCNFTTETGTSAETSKYIGSDVRSIINGSLYNSVFNEAEKTKVLTTCVNNSASTTESDDNQYVCDNTNDKVFVLSYKDCINPDYGFTENPSTRDKLRCCKPSDYAVASRAYTTKALGGEYDRNTYYWTRSIAYNYPSYVLCVNDFGNITRVYGHETVSGIRPAINVHL